MNARATLGRASHKATRELTRLKRLRLKARILVLAVVMTGIGCITVIAAANTYEVIFHRDIYLSDVITTVKLTSDTDIDQALKDHYATKYDAGIFGIPAKIKLPESRQHVNIMPALLQNGEWKASKGVAQTFLTHAPLQKVFGQAVIYMRYNTPTTKHLGHVLSGDVVNIVTTDGWQLGYKVEQTTQRLEDIYLTPGGDSQIVVIMIDDHTGARSCFNANLIKVGERLEE